ncbi:MAG: extracellular solute-binding protein [Sphaerochaeta sp.]
MKKTVIVLLVSILTLSFAFAQGSKEAGTVSTGPVTVTMLYSATQTEAGSLPDDWAGYAVIKDKLGIDLKLDMLPSNPNDQDVSVRTRAAADELPDFFTCSREVWADLAKNGQLLDVTDYYDDMPNRCAVMFDQSARNFVTYEGRIYGFATPSAISGNEGLLVRKDWLDKLGLSAPTTLDQLYDVLYAFTYNDPDGNGKNDTYGYGAFVEETISYEIYPGRRFEPLMGAFGVEGTWDMSAANFGLQIHNAAYYDWMVFFKKCIDNGVIDPNWQSYKKDDFRAAWKQGKFGVFREQNSAYAGENNYAPFDANFPNGSFIVIDAPVGPEGKQSVGPRCQGMRVYAINADVSPEKAAKIVELFDWMSYGEGYLLCGYGEEGKNYILDANGLPQSDESLGDLGYNKAGGQKYIQLRNCAFNYSNATEIALRYPGYITKVSQKYMSAGDVLLEMQVKTWTNTPGQNSMPKPESTDVSTFYQQGIAEFLNGRRELTPANWKAFVEQFDKIGGLAWENKGRDFASSNGLLQ